jgi:tetratricopeptide (TPR) repeat protein
MNLTANPDFNPPRWSSVMKYWRGPAFDLYAPLTFTVWGIIASIAYRSDAAEHLSPLPFHVVSLLLHATTALAVLELLRRSRAPLFASLIGAIFFAVHPIQVEAVAWTSGLKDVLAGLLTIASLVFYLSPGKSSARYVVACALFVLASLAKSSAMVVPPIALILDCLINGRAISTALRRASTLFLLAIPMLLIARHAQPAHQIASISVSARVLVALDAVSFYFCKLVLPLYLGVDYGRRPEIVVARGWAAMTWLPALLVAMGSIFASLRGVRWPGVALAIFVIGVAPVLGLVAFDFQAYSTVADHYLYIAMLGVAIAVAQLLAHRDTPVWRYTSVGVCCILATLTLFQTITWHNALSISEQALQANPNSWASHQQIARIQLDNDHPADALPHARQATQLNPYYATAFITLGEASARLNHFDDAQAAYREAIRLSPRDARARVQLANLLADHGNRDAAIEQYLAALAINPRDVVSLTNLAGVYAELRQFDRAIESYDKALAIDPNFPPARAGRQRAMQEKQSRSSFPCIFLRHPYA